MRCTVTGEPYTVFGYGGKQVRDNIHSADLVRAFEAFHASAARRPRSTTSAAAARATARCSRRSRSASRSPAASSTGRSRDEARIGDHRWWISRPRGVPSATTRTGRCATASSEILREIHDAQRRSAGAWRREALRRHPGPQRGGGRSRRRVGALAAALDAARASTTRSSSSTTRSTRRDRGASCARLAERQPAHPLHPLALPPRLRLRRARRARRASTGDAVAIVMADGSDDPRDVVALLPRCSRRATTARSARASCPARSVHDYPRFKLAAQPGRQRRHPRALPPRLQRHDERVQGLPARGDRERPAAALEPLQPDRRAAAEGGRARPLLRDRADLVDEPRRRASRSCSCRRWAAATCSSCSTCSSSTT